MRFSTSFLAAGLTALALAAPIAEREEFDDCEADDFTSTLSSKAGLGQHTATFSPISSRVAASARVTRTALTYTKNTATRTRSSTTAIIPTSSGVVLSVSTSAKSAVITPTTTAQAITKTSAAATSDITSVAPTTAETSVAITSDTTSAVLVPTSAASSSITSVAAVSTIASSTTLVATSKASSAAASTSTGALEWLGANESGAEFGQTAIPGVLGTDYTWPNTSAIKIMMDSGMNIFRIPILMERIAPSTMTATLDPTYLAALTTVVEFITSAGGSAIIDPHNYGRYAGSIFTSTSDFKTFWTNVATEFKSNDKVIFDCNNEFHDEPSTTVVADLNQACIDGVRAAGATTQYIFVEGTSYTGAWTWVSSGNADAMAGLTDSSDKIVYEMHQYLDSDGSGTSSTCVSTTIGAERIAAATAWLKANNKKGIIGEFAGGVNADCETAVTGLLDALTAASDVWMGALWWGAGPWWGTYLYGLEPSTGIANAAYMPILTKYI